MIDISLATLEDALELSEQLRELDIRELKANEDISPKEAVLKGFHSANLCWAARDATGIVAIGGVSSLDDFMGVQHKIGVPWLLATDRLDKHWITLYRLSKPFLVNMLEIYPTLLNYTDARNKEIINWLRWSGFTIGDTKEGWGTNGEDFVPFYMGELNDRC